MQNPGRRQSPSVHFGLAAAMLVIGASRAAALGPVSASALPGGATVVDDDTNGERWGRVGGRTIAYSAFDLNAFTSLSWGVIGANPPGIAFDGAITPGTAEVLTFVPEESDLAGGRGIWRGSASMELLPPLGVQTLETRFILSVSRLDGTPLALSFTTVGPLPGIDILAAGGEFKVNLRMESHHPSYNGDAWSPVLDLYDFLPQVGPTPGLAHTRFAAGFWYESAAGVSLDQHHAEMIERAGRIEAGVTQANGRLEDLKIRQEGLASEFRAKLDPLPVFINGVGQKVDDLQRRVGSAQEESQRVMLFLFGGEFTPDGGVDPSSVVRLPSRASQESVDGARSDLARVEEKLDALRDAIGPGGPPELGIQALEIDDGRHGASHAWILGTSIHGAPTSAVVTRVLGLDLSKRRPASAYDVTAFAETSEPAVGVLELRVRLPRELKGLDAFVIEMGSGSPPAQGMLLVHRDPERVVVRSRSAEHEQRDR